MTGRIGAAAVAACGLILAVGAFAAPVAQLPGGVRRPRFATPGDPFTSPAMRRFLAGRSGDVTAAVYDVPAGVTFLYRPGIQERTASIAKVDILAALLAQAQGRGGLSAGEQDLAAAMIEASDNKDAQTLYDAIGQLPTLATLDAQFGMTQTTQSWSWGLIETTPRDQLRMLRYIVFPNRVLSTASRKYLLYLMEHVEPGQAWGVSAGTRPGVTVALKNGWDPAGGVWQVNSIGMVRGDHRFYLLAVMTSEPEYAYGVDTITGVSQIIWRELRERARHSPAA
jgi:hypothetical protein